MSDQIKTIAVAIGLASRDREVQFVARNFDRVQDESSLAIKRQLEQQAAAALEATPKLSDGSWPDTGKTVGNGENEGTIGDWYSHGDKLHFFQVRGIDEHNYVAIYRVQVKNGKLVKGSALCTYYHQTDVNSGVYKKLDGPPFKQ